MPDNFDQRMNTMFNNANNKIKENKTPKKPFQKIRKPKQEKLKVKKSKSKANSALKVTQTETKNNQVKSNNKTGHMLLTPIMVDVSQVAQIDALKHMLHLKNRAKVLMVLMNKRQTVSDVVAKLSRDNPQAKKQFKIRYELFLDDHKPKVERNYKKYHPIKK